MRKCGDLGGGDGSIVVFLSEKEFKRDLGQLGDSKFRFFEENSS